MKKIIISSIILLLSYCVTHGQITTGEEPISFQINVPVLKINDNTLKRLPSFDMERVKKEDVEDEANGIPPRFGYKHEVDYNLYNSGEWTELPNGDKLWRLIISSPDALSINLLYDKFWLPDGAKFWVYSNDNKQSIGAITSANNSGTKNNIRGFATNLVFGDQITLEYYLPNHVTEEGIISVAYVVHGYRYILTPGNIKDSYRQSADCQVNINCEEGQSWQNEKNAVVKIIIINRVCTGFLVNNTKEDFYPYVITANHCLCKKYVFGECDEWHDAIRDPNLDYWTFEWHYESPKCENAVPIKRSTVGAKLVANNSISDFALLDLSEENNSYGSDPRKLRGVALHYLGWDRSGSPGTGGVGIHHPNGNIKKISTYTMKPQSTGYTNDNEHENGAHWRVVWASTTYNGVTKHGTTEGGSSGSPLINSDRKVIGQLHGGYSNCTENGKKRPDWYGKFSVSWTGYDATQSQRRLSDWLAPNSSRPPEVLGGIDKPAIPFDPIEGVDLICSPEVYELSPYYFDEDSPVANWRITPDSDLIITSQTTNVNMVFVRAIGSYYGQTATLTATVNGIDYHKEIKACPPSSIKIVGSETICVTETYTLHGDDRFQNLSWDVTEGFTIDDNDDNWVRIIACPKGQPGTLTAIFKGVPIAQILIEACSSWVGAISGPSTIMPPSCEAEYTISNLPDCITDWSWHCTEGLVKVSESKNKATFKRVSGNNVYTALPYNVIISYRYKLNGVFRGISEIVSSRGGFISTVVDATSYMAVDGAYTDRPYYLNARSLSSNVSDCYWIVTPPYQYMPLPLYQGWTTQSQVPPLYFSPAGRHKIELITKDGCGFVKSDEQYIVSSGPSLPPIGPKMIISYSPNPVNSELTIEFIELPNIEEPEEYTVMLLDNLGNAPRQTRFRHRSRDGRPRPVKFNTYSLPPGTYYLHVEGAGELIREQIIVTR